jgi:hypothetical protein
LPTARVIPGAQVLTTQTLDPRKIGDATEVVSHTTTEAARVLGLQDARKDSD